jgi:uncharacterized protein
VAVNGSARRFAVGRSVVAGGIAAAGVTAGAAATALGTYFARQALTPDRDRPDDVDVLAVDREADPPTVTLRRTDETSAPGRYGLWLDGGTGHARLGDVVATPGSRRSVPASGLAGSSGVGEVVVRRLEAVDRGTLRTGPARWNQYYFAGPPAQSLGLAHQDVEIGSELGPLPAWYVPADLPPERPSPPAAAHPLDSRTPSSGDGGGAPATDWAVLVHGRGASREECLRAVRPLHELGLQVLVPAYRNDVDASAAPDARYHLGDSEWRDIDAAIDWVVAQGGRRVVLCGWSMGAAIVLATASRSPWASRIAALVLDAPVVDWRSVLDHHAATHRIPLRVNRIGQRMLRNPLGRRAAGLAEPVDVRDLDWVARADELIRPILLIHSDQDEYVPNGPSIALGRARPDLVQVEPWRQGRHTKEWNTDPERWERVLTDFVRLRLRYDSGGSVQARLDPSSQ